MSAAHPPGLFLVRRRLLRGALAVAGGAGAAGAAVAAPTSAIPLKVVIFALVPFGMLDAAGQPAGITVELQKALARESGLPMTIQVVPYPRAIAMVAAGDADLVFSFQNRQMQQHAQALGVIASGDVVVVGRAGSRYGSRDDLRGKKLGHIRGAQYDEQLQSDPAIARYEAVSYEQMVRMLLEGRFDAVLGAGVSIQHALRVMDVPRRKLGPALVVGRRDMLVHYANKRYDPQVAARLTRALTAMRARGTAAALMKPYEEGDAP